MRQRSSASATTRRAFVNGTAAATVGAVGGTLGFSRLAAAQFDPAKALTQTAAFKINPEKETEALALLATLAKAVEDNEPGVLAYIAHRSQSDPTQLLFFEVYADEEALRAHGQAPHMAPIRQAFGAGVFQGPLEIVKLDRVGGFWR